MKALTPKQAETLNFIRAFQETNGYSPSIAEIAEAANISKTSAFMRVKRLEQRGAIAKVGEKNSSRNFIVVDSEGVK